MLIKLTFNKKFHFFGDRFKPIIISGDTLVCSRMMSADCLHDNITPCHLQLTWNVYCYKSSPHQDTDLCTQPDGILAPFFLHISLGSGWPSSTEHRNLTSSPSFTVMLFSGVVVIFGRTGNYIISFFMFDVGLKGIINQNLLIMWLKSVGTSEIFGIFERILCTISYSYYVLLTNCLHYVGLHYTGCTVYSSIADII